MRSDAHAIGVEHVRGHWYARDVFALVASPDISPTLRSELEAWVRGDDENVRSRRPFAVDDHGLYSFDGLYRAAHGAPAWWVQAWKAWAMRQQLHKFEVRPDPGHDVDV